MPAKTMHNFSNILFVKFVAAPINSAKKLSPSFFRKIFTFVFPKMFAKSLFFAKQILADKATHFSRANEMQKNRIFRRTFFFAKLFSLFARNPTSVTLFRTYVIIFLKLMVPSSCKLFSYFVK